MKIRKYVARNMPEALQQVREDLGDNAVILNTRTLRRNNRFNLHDEARVEVTAAYDEGAAAPPGRSRLAARKYEAQSAHEPVVEPADQPRSNARGSEPPPPIAAARSQPVLEPVSAAPSSTTAAAENSAEDGAEQVSRQLRRLQDTVARLERKGGVTLPDELGRLSERLRSVGLDRAITDRVVGQLLEGMSGGALSDRQQVGQSAAAELLQMLPRSKRIKLGSKRQVIGFFGASGVGKTTAAAKIAAGFILNSKEHIVLVTADDQRVGARDQVGAFAKIIGVPLEFAHTAEEMQVVLGKHERARLVLVDAPGCGPHDHRELDRQAELFAAADVGEIHVVIDALHGFDHMLDILEASRGLPERRLLFTKMDEMVRPGPVLSAAINSQIPTSYLAVGTQVPGDIEAGNLNKLVEKIVGYGPKKKK